LTRPQPRRIRAQDVQVELTAAHQHNVAVRQDVTSARYYHDHLPTAGRVIVF
jgi:hypothetical protein